MRLADFRLDMRVEITFKLELMDAGWNDDADS